jgi:uncharacterized protein (TIGR03000 family)
MRAKDQSCVLLAGLAMGCLLVYAMPSRAQVKSKWGHPVFTIGLSPYDSVNQGHGNYPGGPGFIPGYGYYTGPGSYPWMDGPGTPFDHRKIQSPSVPESGPSPLPAAVAARPDTAVLIVKLPAEAELWLDECRMSQGGSYRVFVTPALAAGSEFSYTVRARWRIKDVELSRSEQVRLEPGNSYTVNFLTVDSWTGRRLESKAGDQGDAEGLPRPREIKP